MAFDVKAGVDRQTNTVHSLPFEPFLSDPNQHEFHPYHQLRDDVNVMATNDHGQT